MKTSKVPLPEEIDYTQKFRLDDKVVIITGARGLIGSAFVEACAQFGAIIVVADISETEPERFCEQLSQRYNRKMLGVSIDVTQRDSVEKLKNKVLETFQKIDGLVNCHQNSKDIMFSKFEEYKDEDWDVVVETNLKGVYMTCQVIGSWMAKNGGGSIVNIPSTYSVVAPNQNLYKGTTEGCPAAYSSSKGGIMALSQYLSTYWATKGIRVNQITPHGIIPYGDWDEGENSFETRFSEMTPIGRMSFNHEVPGALVFLLSEASSYVTGHNLIVDGGWTAW